MRKKPLLSVLKGEIPDRPPFWLMRQAGRYLPEFREMRRKKGGFLDLCYDPEAAAEVTLQPLRRFGMDGAILFSDILVVPHALGQSLDFLEGEGPVLDQLQEPKDLEKLDVSGIDHHLEPVYNALQIIRKRLDEEHPHCTLLGFAGAPWTIASYMLEGRGSRDYAFVKRWMFSEPSAFDRLIQLIVDATVAYLVRQIDAGAEAVQLFDSWAGALPGAYVSRYSLEPMIQIARRVHALRPLAPVMIFPRGVGQALEGYADIEVFAGISLDTNVDTRWARTMVNGRAVVQGNLDPEALVCGGAAMEREVFRIRDDFQGTRHIFNLGHGVVPRTPVEHVAKLAALLRQER